MIVRIARVKVGNRQAPMQKHRPHPTPVGFVRLRAIESKPTETSNRTTKERFATARNTSILTAGNSRRNRKAFPRRLRDPIRQARFRTGV